MNTTDGSVTFSAENLPDAPDALLRLWWYASGASNRMPGAYRLIDQSLLREICFRFLEHGFES